MSARNFGRWRDTRPLNPTPGHLPWVYGALQTGINRESIDMVFRARQALRWRRVAGKAVV
ncbi:hypothetical protein GCM10010390_39750 [Streptomyces mordarskii]|uniref:Uncharacterized protein n=1 Tax=Streptomyces mordarskii TaxID=1226758 RepID=A0ABN1D4E6_9ACTN